MLIEKDSAIKQSQTNPSDKESHETRNLEYIPHDTSTDGYIDTIEIESEKSPKKGELIEVEIEYEHDLKEPIKKKIYRIISWTIGVLVLASFIISIVKFDNAFFWL